MVSANKNSAARQTLKQPGAPTWLTGPDRPVMLKESRSVEPESLVVRQQSFFDECPVTEAVASLAMSGVEERGAIFTKREVVDFILDLAGYTCDQPLFKWRLLEPSFGGGDFLIPVLERLLRAWQASGAADSGSLGDCIRAVELHTDTFERTRARVLELLSDHGIEAGVAEQLVEQWLIHSDFLLTRLPENFDVVIGNPPYVRQELIADALMAEYRQRYETIYDRADLYIPFIERSLKSLVEGGRLGFICSDRWMKNRYGGRLRQLVAEKFHLKVYVDMVDTPAFHSEVTAYPAITLITRERAGATRIAYRPEISQPVLTSLAAKLLTSEPVNGGPVRELQGVASGAEPWILEAADQLAVLRRLEAALPTLEETGCKVGIGVATGADKAFIGKFEQIDVEPDRKLPLVATKDIMTGTVKWKGDGVINPFANDGGLVNLDEYPRLKRYLEARKDQIARRHVAQKAPANWYRTIDRIYPAITARPKLLVPDIKGEAHVVYEEGRLYPHHNLYYVVSDTWDLKALQAVLLSDVTRLFVSIYSTKMRGGYLRFQAQYLRRIRVPHWQTVSNELRAELVSAAERQDVAACNRAVFKLYGLSEKEIAVIQRMSAE